MKQLTEAKREEDAHEQLEQLPGSREMQVHCDRTALY